MQQLLTSLGMGALVGAGVVLDQQTLVPIGAIATVSAVVFWLGKKVQKFEDGQAVLREGQQTIWEKLDQLPCRKPGEGCKNKTKGER